MDDEVEQSIHVLLSELRVSSRGDEAESLLQLEQHSAKLQQTLSSIPDETRTHTIDNYLTQIDAVTHPLAVAVMLLAKLFFITPFN